MNFYSFNSLICYILMKKGNGWNGLPAHLFPKGKVTKVLRHG